MKHIVKKTLSVFLIFTLLSNTLSSSFAQLVTDGSWRKPQADIAELLSKEIPNNPEKTIKELYSKSVNLKDIFDKINRAGFASDYEGEVCYGEICAPYRTYMRGLIWALMEYSEGEGEILINYGKEIEEGVFLGAVRSEDIHGLREGIKAGTRKAIESCESKELNYKVQDECEKGLRGLKLISVLWEKEEECKESADIIYKALKRNKDSGYSSMVMIEGIAALSFIDSDYSYGLIEKFLTKDTIPSVMGEGLRRTWDLLSLQGIYDNIEGVAEGVQGKGPYIQSHGFSRSHVWM